MSNVNTAFCKMTFESAKYELRQRFGTKTANRLLHENMDVSGSKTWGYALHWVKDGIIIFDDLYKEKRCDNIDGARADAIWFLLSKLFPSEE